MQHNRQSQTYTGMDGVEGRIPPTNFENVCLSVTLLTAGPIRFPFTVKLPQVQGRFIYNFMEGPSILQEKIVFRTPPPLKKKLQKLKYDWRGRSFSEVPIEAFRGVAASLRLHDQQHFTMQRSYTTKKTYLYHLGSLKRFSFLLILAPRKQKQKIPIAEKRKILLQYRTQKMRITNNYNFYVKKCVRSIAISM